MIFGQAANAIDLSNQLVAIATGESARGAVVVADAGSGYVAGEVLTVTTGTPILATRIEVLTVDTGGEVLTARIFDNGAYATGPTGNLAVTGGSGSGAEFNVAYESNGWTAERDTTHAGNLDDSGDVTDREVILKGEGGGTDEIFIAWRTFRSPSNNYFNMELQAFTGYISGNSYKEQPGAHVNGYFDATLPISHTTSNVNNSGCYQILQNTPFNFALNINSYRLILTCNIGVQYGHSYLGWGNRYGTDVDYPYPMIVSGPCDQHFVSPASTGARSGLPDPVARSSWEGPCRIMLPGGTWQTVQNARSSTSTQSDWITWPYRSSAFPAFLPTEDRFTVQGFRVSAAQLWIYSGTLAHWIFPTPPGDERLLLPVNIYRHVAPIGVLMEVDEMFAVSAQGGLGNEDRIIVDGEYYRVYQQANRSDLHNFIAIKE